MGTLLHEPRAFLRAARSIIASNIVSVMPHDFKPLQCIVFFICVQTCFLQGDADLFFHGIDAVQVPEKIFSPFPQGHRQ